MWNKLVQGVIYFGMPVVMVYHFVCGNVFLNTSAQNAGGFETVGNVVLTPVQFLLAGKEAILDHGKYRIEQRFDYHHHLPLKTTAAVFSLPVALPLGSLLKGLAYLTPETRQRHQAIVAAIESTEVHHNLDYYQSLGLSIHHQDAALETPQYQRRPGDENVLPLEKALLRDIVRLFNENKIPFWVDCGTCLGAYRYGGAIPWDGDVDVAILLPDFENVMHALNGLDKTKYQVQDWSNRCRPKTYIRVYIHENHNCIDIYHFAIDPEKKTIASVLSNGESSFMKESWIALESRFTIPSSFDTVFPLKKAYFDGIEVFVPNQTKKYLQERYGENISPVKIYNDSTGEYEKDLAHPYWKIPYVY